MNYNQKIKRLTTAVTITMTVFIAVEAVLFISLKMSNQAEPLINFLISFIALLLIRVLCGYYFSTLSNERKLNKGYFAIFISSFIYAFMHFFIYVFLNKPKYTTQIEIFTTLLFISGLVFAYFFNMYYLNFLTLSKKHEKIIKILITTSFIAYTALVVSNQFTHILFTVNTDGTLSFPKTYFITDTYPIIWFLYNCVMIIISKHDKKTKGALMSYIHSAIFFVLVDVFSSFNENKSIAVGSLLVIGPLISMYTVFFRIYATNTLEMAETKRKLTEKQTQIMISQIQPHFLYNTLSAIYQLCDDDPALAKTSIKNFSLYLRRNLDSLGSNEPIPFSKELEHIKTYLEIEKLRFEDLLTVKYNIEYSDFRIPSLSLQPLVENAVKYGIRSREEGGTITITTELKDNKIYISVHDDGTGFDINATLNQNNHTGIENSRYRIKSMSGGQLLIDSNEQTGTTATIILEAKNEAVISR